MNLDLRKLLKRGAYVMAAVAFLAMWTGGGVGSVLAALLVLLGVASWFWEAPRVDFAAFQKPMSGLTVLFIGFCLYLLIFTEQGFVQVGVYLVLYLTVAKLFQRERLADYIQLLALTFLLIAASTAYNEDIIFAVFFATYVVVGVITFSVYHLCTQIEENEARGGRRVRQLFGGQYLSVLSGMALISFFSAVAFFFLFPRLGFGFFAQKTRDGLQLSGFSESVDLGKHGAIKDDNTVVMRVQFPDGRPPATSDLHWRGTSLDYYDGIGWKQRLKRRIRLQPDGNWNFLLPEARWAPGEPQTLRQSIYLEPIDGTDVLFALHPALSVGLSFKDKHVPSWIRQRSMTLDAGGAVRTQSENQVGYQYTAISRLDQPSVESLRAVSHRDVLNLPDRYREAYTQLPVVSPRLKALAQEITQGADNDYDRVRAIADHLQNNYTYTTDLPDPGVEPPVEAFLFGHKRGHCEYFATSMVLLVRSLGIPARITNGFLGGKWNDFDDFLAVRNADAHSWVEVYLGSNHRWITFDPTPASANVSNVESWSDGLFKFYDSMRFKWLKYVIEYDLETQVEFLRQAASTVTGQEQELDLNKARVTLVDILHAVRRNWPPGLLVCLLSLLGYGALRLRGRAPLDWRDVAICLGTVGGSALVVQLMWKPQAGWIATSFSLVVPLSSVGWGLAWRKLGGRSSRRRYQGISQLYHQLRQALGQAGMEGVEALGPEALLESARRQGMPARSEREQLVRRYMAVRFGGEVLDSGELRDLNLVLRKIKKALRAHH